MENSEWISVYEHLPEIMPMSTMTDWVLAYGSQERRIYMSFYSRVTGWQTDVGSLGDVTHWQKLPSPPKQ